MQRAQADGIAVADVEKFTAASGLGAEGFLKDKSCLIGNHMLIENEGISVDALDDSAAGLAQEGKTIVYVALEKTAIGLIALADVPKTSAKQAIESLKRRGLKVMMVTGDNAGTAKAIAGELGIDQVLADVLPGNKADEIRKLQKKASERSLSNILQIRKGTLW